MAFLKSDFRIVLTIARLVAVVGAAKVRVADKAVDKVAVADKVVAEVVEAVRGLAQVVNAPVCHAENLHHINRAFLAIK